MRFLVRFVVFLLAILAAPAFAQVIDTPIAGRPPIPSVTDPENLWYLDLSTGGRVIIWLRPDAAPKTVERIKILTRQHFYDGLPFHRVIEGFMAQGGDPKGDGTGGSTLPDLKAEFNWLPHVRGAVSAARAEKEDSANSQFFIVFDPKLSLDKKYTVFGRVIDGMQYVDAITRGEPPANPSRIVHAYIAADHPPAYVSAPPVPAATLSPSSLGGAFLSPGTPPGKPASTKTPNAKTLRAPAVVKPKAAAQ